MSHLIRKLLNPLCSSDFNTLSKCFGELTAAYLNQKFCQSMAMMGESRNIILLKAKSYSVCSLVIFRTVVFNQDYPITQEGKTTFLLNSATSV